MVKLIYEYLCRARLDLLIVIIVVVVIVVIIIIVVVVVVITWVRGPLAEGLPFLRHLLRTQVRSMCGNVAVIVVIPRVLETEEDGTVHSESVEDPYPCQGAEGLAQSRAELVGLHEAGGAWKYTEEPTGID